MSGSSFIVGFPQFAPCPPRKPRHLPQLPRSGALAARRFVKNRYDLCILSSRLGRAKRVGTPHPRTPKGAPFFFLSLPDNRCVDFSRAFRARSLHGTQEVVSVVG